VEEDFEDLNDDGECSQDDDDDIQLVRDENGDPIEAELDGESLNAVNNIGARKQTSYGLSGQLTLRNTVLHGNQLSLGAGWSRGDTDFDSGVEVAQLLANRSTSRTGIFADEFRTAADSTVDTASAYLVDTLRISERIALTLAARYDNIRIDLADRSGESPLLDGSHRFSRLNPAAGVTAQLSRGVTLYASYGESARAPSPVELACASEEAPCNLPNAFLADPPLDQVVARSAELGVRGGEADKFLWNLGLFHTRNRNDILFQATGGPQGNVGFFDNVADTLREGIELRVSQQFGRARGFFDYSYVKATFDDAFIVNSPNHPVFEDDPGSAAIAGDGKLFVGSGATIPGIPRHQANAGVDFEVTSQLAVGADVSLRSGVYLRGDEANLLKRTDAFAVFNLHGQYRFGERATIYARIENLLDRKYETFGILGEPEEVFAQFTDPRFYGAGPPFGAWLGVRLSLR
jgi:outer membrane receptor protein involved in Fe transport